MKHKSFILSLAMVFCLAVGAGAADYNLSLQATTDGNTVDTVFPPGSNLYLNIDLVAPETGKVAGTAFTLTYPSDKLTAPATNADGLPTDANAVTSTLLMMTINSNNEKTHRVNSATAGEILFSGAAIDTTGGSGFHYQDATLFTVKFTVKDTATGDITFGLKQTVLTNADAGWNGEGVPILVGAIPNTDANYGGTDLSDDFPVLLQNFAANPTLTVSAGTSDYATWKASNPAYAVLGGPMEDYDGDGFTNDQERLNGSDPLTDTGDIANVDVTNPATWTAVGANYNALTDFRVSNLDVDGNKAAELGTDGVLLIRYLFGYRGDELIAGAIGAGATRDTAAKIEAYIAAVNEAVYDVDASGKPALGEDGVVLLRYLFGYRGAELIKDAVDTGNCKRCTSDDIEAYIKQLFPQ